MTPLGSFGFGLHLGADGEVDDADGRKQRALKLERVRGGEQLVRDPCDVAPGVPGERLEPERRSVRRFRRAVADLVRERDIGRGRERSERTAVLRAPRVPARRRRPCVRVVRERHDRDLPVDPVRHVELSTLSRDSDARGEPADGDRRGEDAERAIDDGDGVAVLHGDVEPARVRRVPHGGSRMRADRDGADRRPRAGVDERDRSATTIDRREPAPIGAERDAAYVGADRDLLDERVVVDVGVAHGADVTVRGPHAAPHRVEDQRGGRGIDASRRRDDRRRGALERSYPPLPLRRSAVGQIREVDREMFRAAGAGEQERGHEASDEKERRGAHGTGTLRD